MKRYSAHKNSFRNEKHSDLLSMENGFNSAPTIEWEIIRTALPYRPGRGNCQLCIQEKAQINAQAGNQEVLNKRVEKGQTCHHKARYKLTNV